ncbi:MAG: hypothetical protein LBQ48_04860 [Oscillospiraceae bacterium]|jgi:protein-tyrosine phosphatase|nr:hypothetical protein [Oscillospiraceae bacterium]
MILDIHSHIVFGVDDGARTLDESKKMLNAAAAAGITHICATPHVYAGRFDPELYNARFSKVKREAARRKIALIKGYELSMGVLEEEGAAAAPRFCIEGTRNLLVEFLPGAHISTRCIYLLDEILRKNMVPVIAHPERYHALKEDKAVLNEFVNMGCRFQVTARVMHTFLKPELVCRMMKRGQLDFLGVDAHRVSDYTSALPVIKKYPEFFSGRGLEFL